MTPEELRRRRENDSIALRKQKRDEQLSKRRNMDVTEETDQLSAEVRKFVRIEFVQYWRKKTKCRPSNRRLEYFARTWKPLCINTSLLV